MRPAGSEVESPGLVLGHAVLLRKVGSGEAHRGKVRALDPVTIRLDLVRWSGAYRAGDRLLIYDLSLARRLGQIRTPGGPAFGATVESAAHGVLHLNIAASSASIVVTTNRAEK